MARIRSIKPDAFESDTLSQVPRGVRWTFAGLWTYCDDDGRGRDNLRLIQAALYPLDADVTLDVVADDLKQLESVGAICRYVADGRDYLHIPAWVEHQRVSHPTPSKLPSCPRCHEQFANDSGKDPEALVPELNRKEGNRREGSPELFDEFWAAYPRKTDKGNAKKAWVKAVKKKPAAEIIAAALAYAATKPEPKYTAHPTTWLNGERWDDEHARAPTEPKRIYTPLEVPDDIDPDDSEAYAAFMREAANG